MSEATTWAAAQRVPDRSAQHVLEKMARWAQADDCVWLKVEIIAFEMGCTERTVQRSIEYLLAMDDARLERTPRKHTYKGKVYPVYRLRLDIGPKNTTEAMRLAKEAATEPADLGVTPTSPQEISPDTHVTPTGDTGDALGVTPVTPHHLKAEIELEIKPKTGAREAAFERLLSAWSAVAPHRVSRVRDWPVFEAMCEAGFEPEAMAAAAIRCLAEDPDVRAKRVLALYRWLGEQRFEFWAPKAGEAAERSAIGDAVPPDVVEALGAAFLASWARDAEWRPAERLLITRLGLQADRIRADKRAELAAHGVRVLSRAELETMTETQGVR